MTAMSKNTKALAGAPILRVDDTFTVAGCPLNISGSPHPCITVKWQNPSRQTKADGGQALTTDSMGLCQAADQAVQGPVQIISTQMKASAL